MADSEVKGRLPYPPSINKYWITRNKKHPITGKTIKTVTRTPEVKKYVQDVAYLLKHQKINAISAKRLRLELYIYPPDHKKRDIDNVCKAILDALQHANLYADDYHIEQLYVERREVRKWGEVEFVLRGLEN